ncbi:MAG: hypothetical protein RL722_1954 [Pseudomonadota bacterium]|jgi:flagellar basal-body rod modification protein FlgD
MTTTSATSASNAAAVFAQLNGKTSTSSANSATDAAAMSDRFMTLLVAQLKNQDPMAPMDNAQMTSQMAQISTVSGIDKLNTSIAALGSQFTQLQALQGASLVGRGVMVEGKAMNLDAGGSGRAAVEVAGAADSVKVEVLNGAGRVVDTLSLGAQGAGRHDIDWTPPAGTDTSGKFTFKVTALSGSTAVATTTLQHDQVEAVSTSGSSLSLELAGGKTVAYSDVKAFD